MADQWSERVSGHRINQALTEASEAVSKAVADSELTDQATRYLRRFQLAISHVQTLIEATDAVLVPLQTLENGANHVQPVANEVESFLSNRNEAHLANAETHIDNLLTEMRFASPPTTRKELAAAAKAAQKHSERLLDLESPVREALTKLKEEIATQSKAIKGARNQVASVEKAATEKIVQVNTDADARLTELRTGIDSQKARLDDAIAHFQSTFADAQEERSTKFSESQNDLEKSYAARLEETLSNGRSRLGELDTEAQSFIESLRGYEEQASRVLGVTAASGVAGSYLNEAKEQRREADVWRVLAFVVAAVLFIGTVVSTVVSPPSSDSSATALAVFAAIRLPVGSVIAGAFFYAIRQSGHHRDREQRSKHLAMQLTAFRPFLAELPEDQVVIQLVEAVKRFFPGYDPPTKAGS